MLHTNESKVFRYIFFEMYPKLQVFFFLNSSLTFYQYCWGWPSEMRPRGRQSYAFWPPWRLPWRPFLGVKRPRNFRSKAASVSTTETTDCCCWCRNDDGVVYCFGCRPFTGRLAWLYGQIFTKIAKFPIHFQPQLVSGNVVVLEYWRHSPKMVYPKMAFSLYCRIEIMI